MRRKKVCTVCGQPKWLKDMAHIGEKGAPAYKRRSYCKTCKRKKNSSGSIRRRIDKYRQSDKKRGFTGTMSADDLRKILSQACVYCGSANKMTADRKDNDAGHTVENCVPACWRCNSMRARLPYEAWAIIAEAVRKARDLGLLPDSACAGLGYGLRRRIS